MVYRTFADPRPEVIKGCPCCIAKRGVDVLLTTPLREISGDALWSYVSGVFHTVGSAADFRYLLPRILDIAVNHPDDSNDPEVILGKVGLAGWQGWPQAEREALEQFADAWFELVLAQDLANAAKDWVTCESEHVLCGMARMDLPLGKWLQRLQQPDAKLVLLDIVERYPRRLSAFWKDAPAGLAELGTIAAP